MSTMTTSQESVGCLVCNVALGHDGKVFQRRIEYFLSKNGEEWTCGRLKAVWNAALLLRNGDREMARKVYQDNSIAYHKQSLLPRGIEGRVVQRFVEAQRPAVLKRLSAAMRFYTGLMVPELTSKQRKKALKAISGKSECNRKEANNQGFTDMALTMTERRMNIKPMSEDPLRTSEIHAEHLKALSKYYSRYPVPKEVRGEPYSSMAMSFMTEPWVPERLDRVTPCKEMRDLIRNDPWSKANPQLYAGKITALQEQGCKARVVCQPSAWLQLAFMPLHNRVARIAEALFPKESCVNDQVKGAYALMAHLQHGSSVFCTDLSSATDRFPRDYTIGVLEAMGYQRYAQALSEVCSMPFKCDFAPGGFIRYEVGQPMGLYGSFPLFHLSNMLMADAAVRQTKETSTPVAFHDGSYFKTVGDDIIFSDGNVAANYRTKMESLGVTISEAKSFSGSVGEFAGFIGLRTNQSAAVYRPYKVPVGNSLNNGLQFVDSLGQSLNRLGGKWPRIIRLYNQTIASRDLALEPLVPDSETFRMNSFRGDNRVMKNMCEVISQLADNDQYPLPDLSGNTQINELPLFRERGMFDYYGYNPDEFTHWEKDQKPEVLRTIGKSLSRDPLYQEVRRIEKGEMETPTRLIVKSPKRLEKLKEMSKSEVPAKNLVKKTVIRTAPVQAKPKEEVAPRPEVNKPATRETTPSDGTLPPGKPKTGDDDKARRLPPAVAEVLGVAEAVSSRRQMSLGDMMDLP